MSVISDALQGNNKIYYLLEIDLEGQKLRYSTSDVHVKYASGTDLLFKGKLRSDPVVSRAFDFRSFRYNASVISVSIINDERLQDLEMIMKIDYATAKIWLWPEGLDWSYVINKPIFYGAVRKRDHNQYWYSIDLIDFVSTKYDAISDETFTGTPAEVVKGVIDGHSSLDISQVDYGSIWDLDSLLGSLSLSVLVDQRADTFDVVDRILGQCKCARTQRHGKVSTAVFDINAPTTYYVGKYDLETEIDGISATPFELICNNLEVKYGPAAGAWGTTITRDRTNNPLCRQSYAVYGPQPQRQLLLADCDSSADAELCINRHLDFFAFRHDIIPLDLPFYKAWNMLEGDVAEITLEEGASSGGAGWVNEKFILVEKSFMSNFIRTRWWRIGT